MQLIKAVGLLCCTALITACNLALGGLATLTPPPTIAPTLAPTISASATLSLAQYPINEAFQLVRPALKTVAIPLRLPASLDDFAQGRQIRLYLTVLQANKDNYALAITAEPNCPAHACTLGHLIGTTVAPNPVRQGIKKQLSNGISAYYLAPECGANCADGELTWLENNIYYTITARGDDPDRLVKIANSTFAVNVGS